MATAIRMKDLRALNKRDREQAIKNLADEAAAPVNGQAYAIKARIQAFEARYEFSSDELGVRLSTGRITETADIAEWLFFLRLRSVSGG